MNIRTLLAQLRPEPAAPRLTVAKSGTMTEHDVYRAVVATTLVVLRESGPFIAAITLRKSCLDGRPTVIRGEVFHATNCVVLIDTCAIDPVHIARIDIY